MHINETAEKRWIQQRWKARRPVSLSPRAPELLHWLVAARAERYCTPLRRQKRFSLEAARADSMMDELMQQLALRRAGIIIAWLTGG